MVTSRARMPCSVLGRMNLGVKGRLRFQLERHFDLLDCAAQRQEMQRELKIERWSGIGKRELMSALNWMAYKRLLLALSPASS